MCGVRKNPRLATSSCSRTTLVTDLDLDPAGQVQVLAEHRCLDHGPLAPQEAAVALPSLAVTAEARGDGADASVDGVLHGLSVRVEILIRRRLIHEEDVIEPAGDDQPREGAQPTETAFAFIFVQAGIAKARGRMPADRQALVVAVGNIHRPVDEHRKAETGAGPELEHTHTALHPVAKRHEAHTGELGQRPAKRRNVALH